MPRFLPKEKRFGFLIFFGGGGDVYCMADRVKPDGYFATLSADYSFFAVGQQTSDII